VHDTWTREDVGYVVAAPGELTAGARADGWVLAKKKTLTPMLAVEGPLTIATQEGDHELPEGWLGFVAVDQAGYPYPIAKGEQEKTYEVVDAPGPAELGDDG
jgi:hypothetical protein